MTTLHLFGTKTSPYVRRVRIVAHELGVGVELVDTSTDAGQAALREFQPIWKVPAAKIDGAELFDSAVICQYLLSHHGPGPLYAEDPKAPDALLRRNVWTVVDGALDSVINLFYMAKEGLSGSSSVYLRKQQERAASAVEWVERRMSWSTPERFGLPEIALVTTLEWMQFRNTYPVEAHPQLVKWLEGFASRPSVRDSAPPR